MTAGGRCRMSRPSIPGSAFTSAALNTGALPLGTRIDFTWRRQDTGEWRGRDDAVEVTHSRTMADCGSGQYLARDNPAAR